MRPILIVVLASCAGAEVHKQLAEPEPAPIASVAEEHVDPWAVSDDPTVTVLTPPPPPRPDPSAPAVFPELIEMPASGEKIVKPAPGRVATGMHGDSIRELAVDDAGTVAITVDRLDGARMWPTFDGTREPVIISLRARHSLAVVRVDGDVVVAGLDEIGQLELLRLRATGEMVKRTAIATRRPLVMIRAAGTGFVGVLDDRAVVVFDAAGKLRGELIANAGQHVATLAVRRERALAIVEAGGKVHGRWIDLGTVAWAASTPELPIEATHVALSPDFTRVSGVQNGGKQLAIVKLATGAVLSRPIKENFVDPSLRPIAFTERGALLIARADDLMLWRSGTFEHLNIFTLTASVSGESVVAASDRWLAISEGKDQTEWLGYRSGGPFSMHVTRQGFLINDGVSAVELDRTFAAKVVHEMPRLDQIRYALSPQHALGDRHMLVRGYANGKHGAYVVDLDNKQAKLVVTPASLIDYDPTSRLAAFYGRDGIEVMRWNPKTSSFGSPVKVPDTAVQQHRSQQQLVHLDPGVSGGPAIAFVTLDSDLHAEWTLYRVVGEDTLELDETKRGKRTVTWEWLDVHGIDEVLPARMRAQAKQSPDGKLVAEVDTTRIKLRDRKGNELWTVPSHGAHRLTWSPTGELYAWGGSLARLDVATGDVRECKCGWRFGRWPQVPEGWGSAAMCEMREHF